ncbi:MAG TPA: amidohydrolase family protein, partial [Acidobacteriota bacterium]|nr:amidohydrolase family protein [Acidobacteriota bacterium]
MQKILVVLFLVWALQTHSVLAQDRTVSYDIVIRNGRIIDGTGSPWYSGDVGIRDGRIAAIGNLADAKATQIIDAHGLVIAPGFIDMLGQSETTILVNPHVPSKIFQGITTEITGEGTSVAPQTEATLAQDRDYYEHYGIKADWHTFAEYFARLEKQGIGINLGSYVGATQVRLVVLGQSDVQPTPAQLDQMKALVRQAMKEGALGVSTSLEYPPAPYAKTEELIALAAEAAPFGGIYATHMRSEGDGIISGIDEAVRIGREAKVGVEIWHFKVAGQRNFGRMQEAIDHINQARAAGVDIEADTYAYTAWSNDLGAFIPPWAHDGGSDKLIARLKDPATRDRIKKEMDTPSNDWDNEWDEIPGPDAVTICSVNNPKLQGLLGKSIAEIAKMWGKDPKDTIFDLLIEDDANPSIAAFGMSEPDVALALQQPWVSVNNDSSGTSTEGILGQDHPHPRAYGTFPRILRKYVREEHKLTLEDAIRKFTSLAAQRMRLVDRGVLKEGMWADIVVFDPATITDKATFENPNQYSEG